MSEANGPARPFGASGATPPTAPGGPRRSVLLPTLVTLGALLLLLAIFTGVWTDRLWFASVDYSSVFTKVLLTRAALFIVGALLVAGAAVLNIVIAYRQRPLSRVAVRRNDSLERYRAALEPIRSRAVIAVGVLLGLVAGSVTAGQWESFLLWWHGESFGRDDTYFTSVDLGFFVFDYPWLRFVTSFGFTILTVSILAAGITHYLYGAIDLQARRDRVTGAAQTQLSILIGLFVLLKAWAYWLDRYGFAITDGGLFTGVQYTDANARIPAKEILVFIAVICGILLLINAWQRSWLLPGIGLGLLLLSSILLSGVWPAIMQSFQVKPSEPEREGEFIARNIESTRDAYVISEVDDEDYNATPSVTAADLADESEALPNTRLLDPTLVSPAFEQLQQVRGFYSVPPSLDVDRYTFEGADAPEDVVVAAREINLDGLDASQRNWANDHTVYTHGFGMIAAYGDRRGAEGQPEWAERSIPPEGQLTQQSEDGYQSRIYFGENTPEYSIVGSDDDTNREVDFPTSESSTSEPTLNTYDGDGGVPVGNIINKALYALKFGEPNIVLSSLVNGESQILYDRDPRDRVNKVAPWLTVDGNSYPAVVDGKVVWIVDAYTTSNTFPNAERLSLEESTSDTLTAQGSTATLPSDQITYLRNSVKATVDAYTGEVALYQWDDEDPLLQAWMDAFPDTVTERGDVPEELVAHLRYPEDLFKVQRDVLAEYHVTDSGTFYQGSDRWEVPADPSTTAGGGTTLQPPYYLSVQMPETSQPTFSLTSVYVPRGRENLASFVAVNSNAADENYGEIRILRPPADRIDGPSQIANKFQNDQGVADALLNFRQNEDFAILYGNLLTLPAGNGLLYVQPIYTQRSATSGSGVFPLLQYVVASFGQEVGIGRNLEDALEDALGDPINGSSPGEPTEPPGGGNPQPDPEPDPGGPGTPEAGSLSDQALRLLAQADRTYAQAQAALQDGDLGTYQELINRYNRQVERARDLIAQLAEEAAGGANGDGGAQATALAAMLPPKQR